VAPAHRLIAVLSVAALVACQRTPVPAPEAPASPEATLGQFLAAVNANDHGRMAELWGDERGPSSVMLRNNGAKRDSLMTIYQHLLLTDSAHVIGSGPVPEKPSRRLLQVELFRAERRTVVPFTMAPLRHGGWLVWGFDPAPLMPQVNAPARR